jgi:hypothetical protein
MIDAPTNAHRYRVTDRSVLVISSGPYGHPAGATGVHARRTATLPEAVGRRQRGSAMFAAKPHEAEQELPEGIPEPRNVTRERRRPVATGDQTFSEPKNGPTCGESRLGRQPARQVFFRPGLLRGVWPEVQIRRPRGRRRSNSCNIFPLLGGNRDVSDVVTQSEHCGG